MKYFSAANGIYQNSVFGMVAKLPTKYTGAVILGTVNINLYNYMIKLYDIFIFRLFYIIFII